MSSLHLNSAAWGFNILLSCFCMVHSYFSWSIFWCQPTCNMNFILHISLALFLQLFNFICMSPKIILCSLTFLSIHPFLNCLTEYCGPLTLVETSVFYEYLLKANTNEVDDWVTHQRQSLMAVGDCITHQRQSLTAVGDWVTHQR